MQANTITLPVDVLNNGTPVNKEFVRSEETVNRTTYRGPGHTVASRNIMQLYRTFPKRSGNYLGALKPTIKFTRDVTVPNADGSGDVVVPVLLEISASLPVGLTAALAKEIRQHGVAALDLEEVMSLLFEYGDI
jgi:hypothetical protein